MRLIRRDRLSIEKWRGASIRLAPGGGMSGPGKLVAGFRWPAYPVERTLVAVENGASLVVSGQFTVHTGCRIIVDAGARLEMGSGYMNSNGAINCFHSIKIGRDVLIAENVTIRDSDNHSILSHAHKKDGSIVIGDRVWIGINATILKGVTIGGGAIIAAGSVVVHDVPARSLVGGVPAKLLRENVDWA